MPRSIYTVPAQPLRIAYHTTKDGRPLPLLGSLTRPSGVLAGPVALVDRLEGYAAASNAAVNTREWTFAEYRADQIGDDVDVTETSVVESCLVDHRVDYRKYVDEPSETESEAAQRTRSIANQTEARAAVFDRVGEWPDPWSGATFAFGETAAQPLRAKMVSRINFPSAEFEYVESAGPYAARVEFRQAVAPIRWIIFPGAAPGAQVKAQINFPNIAMSANNVSALPTKPVRLAPHLLLLTPSANWNGQWPAAGTSLQRYAAISLGTLDVPVASSMANATHFLDEEDAPTMEAIFTIPPSRILLPVLLWHSGTLADFIDATIPIARDSDATYGSAIFSIANSYYLTILDSNIGT